MPINDREAPRRWKQMPYWLRGAIIGAVGGLLLFGVGVVTGGGMIIDQLVWWAPFGVILILGPLGLCNAVVCQPEGVSFLHPVTIALGWGVVGTMIGLIVGRITQGRNRAPVQPPS